MDARLIVPAIVLCAGALIAAGIFIPMAIGAAADYARLFPEPSVLAWQQGDEQVLWLDTNRDGVELRISGLDNGSPAQPALALGDIQVRAKQSADILTVARASFDCDDAYPEEDDNGTFGDTTDDFGYAALWLDADAGVGIQVCGDSAATAAQYDADDKLQVSLYDGSGGDATVLAAYDLLAAVPAPTPVANASPVFDDGTYTTRRVCVDSSATRAGYLSGNESVGAAVDADDTELGATEPTYALGVDDPHQDYLFFEVDSSGQLSVNQAGANDTSGLDDDRVYPVVITASDGDGGTARIVVAVQVDTATESPNDDGLCS